MKGGGIGRKKVIYNKGNGKKVKDLENVLGKNPKIKKRESGQGKEKKKKKKTEVRRRGKNGYQ